MQLRSLVLAQLIQLNLQTQQHLIRQGSSEQGQQIQLHCKTQRQPVKHLSLAQRLGIKLPLLIKQRLTRWRNITLALDNKPPLLIKQRLIKLRSLVQVKTLLQRRQKLNTVQREMLFSFKQRSSTLDQDNNNLQRNKAFLVCRVQLVLSNKHWIKRLKIKPFKIMLTHSSIRLCSWAQCLTCSVVCPCKRLQQTNTLHRLTHCPQQLVRLVLVRLFITPQNLALAALRVACLVSLNTQRAV